MRCPVVITPPAALPVRVDAVKNFARISTDADDELIKGFIATATEQAELFTGLSLITRSLRITLDRFPRNLAATPWWNGTIQGPVSLLHGYPDPIELPRGPILSVSEIKTYDAYDAMTVVDPAAYRLDTAAGRILLRQDQYWPTNLRDSGAIEITYVAGYGDHAANVPQTICTAILIQAQVMYDSRSACGLCDDTKLLLQPYRKMRL